MTSGGQEASPSARSPWNGLFLATALAGAFGAFVLALLTVLNEASSGVSSSLTIIERVGPLSCKVIWALVAWVALAGAFRTREFDWKIPLGVAGVLLGIAFIVTFPPIFEAFASD
jgi:hypothetical protein